MASRRKKDTKPLDASSATTASVTAALLPDGVPTGDDGAVESEGVDLDVDTIRQIGAIDATSARLNKTQAEVQTRKKAGEKNVRWNDTNGLVKYDGILAIWPPTSMLAYVSRTDPSPAVDYPPMPCGAMRNGQALYDAIMRNMHRVSGPATYFVRLREGPLERGSFTLNLPDTTPQQQMQSPMMMQPPWMGGGMGYPSPFGPPPGYGYPPPAPGYPPPPGYPPHDPYNQPPPQAAPAPPAAAPAAAPAPAAPLPSQTQQGYPSQQGYPQQQQPIYQPIMMPQPAPQPPAVADPAAQAWMGTMYQMLQDLKQRVEQTTQGSQRAEMERLFAMIEELKRGSAAAPTMQQLAEQIAAMSHPPAQPPPAPAPALSPAAIPPPGFGMSGPAFGAVPGGTGGQFSPPFGGMANPYAQLGALPRPPGWPEHLQWPPNPWANPWGAQPPAPAQPAPAPVAAPPVDPLSQVRSAVEMVGSLASLMDRARGVAPAVSEATTAAAAIAPVRTPAIETVKIGEVDVAMNPETGDVSWLHTLIGIAPKAFGFMEKFTSEAAKTMRSHDAAQAIQSGRMPMQYMPMQPHPGYPPGFVPPGYQPPQMQPPAPQYAPPQYSPPAPPPFAAPRPNPPTAAAPSPIVSGPVAGAPVQPQPRPQQPIAPPVEANGFAAHPPQDEESSDEDAGVSSLFS